MSGFTARQFEYLKPTQPMGGKARAEKILEQLPLHPEDALALYGELAFVCFPGVDHPTCEKACDYLIANGNDEDVFNGCWLKGALCENDDARLEEMVKLYKKCEELEPNHEGVHEHLGRAYNRQRKFDDAIRHTDRCIEIIKEENDGEEYDWLYEELGQAYFGKQDYEKAFEIFSKAVELKENVDAICGLGRVRAQQERYDEALQYFQQAIDKDPEDAYPYFYMGVTWSRKDDFYRAMHFYTEALKRKPDFGEVYNDIGKLYHDHEGDVKTAVENMLKAIEAANGNEKFLSMVYLNVSKLYEQMAEFELAEHYKSLFMQTLGFDFDIDDDGEEGEDDDDTAPLN